jgi:hypothetical protein
VSKMDEKELKELDAGKINYTIVGSYSLLLNGYKIKPNDIDIIVEKKDLDKAKSLAKDVEVYEGKPSGRFLTKEEYRKMFLENHMTDDLMIEKLARHAVDDPKILDLFDGTEIMFVLESMKKDLERKLVKK